MNPRATAPTLETKNGVLRDSIAILAWLDQEYPRNPLFGTTPQEGGIIWQTTMECCDYLRKSTDQLLSLVFSSDGSVPAKGSNEREALDDAVKLVHEEYKFLENTLADGGFTCAVIYQALPTPWHSLKFA